MGPTPNGSSALQRFERGNALEIRNGIMFDFYPGLPHIQFRELKSEKDVKILTLALLLYMPFTYSGLIMSHVW